MRGLVCVTAIVVVLGGFVAIDYGFAVRREPVVQPIAFNHMVHLDNAGMECTDCHTDAATGVYAGLPGKNICFDCHDIDEEESTNPEKDRLFAFADTDVDIPWRPVAVLKPDVFFSHRRHVTSAKLDCLQCHPNQRSRSAPPRFARLVMSMKTCRGCHEKNNVSTDCLICHR